MDTQSICLEAVSRYPSYQRRYSPSPIGRRHSRRDRSPSPYNSMLCCGGAEEENSGPPVNNQYTTPPKAAHNGPGDRTEPNRGSHAPRSRAPAKILPIESPVTLR